MLFDEVPDSILCTMVAFMRLFVQVVSESLYTTQIKLINLFENVPFSVLVMAECFSVMPVNNVNSENPKDIFYSWKSFRNFYSIVNMLLIFAFTIVVIMWSLSARLQFDTIGKLLPFSFNLSPISKKKSIC